MKKKATKSQSMQRSIKIKELILEGMHSSDIVHYCAENWNISTRQSNTYIKKAYDLLHDKFKERVDTDIDFHLSARMDIYKRAMDLGYFRVALRALEDIAKIRGHYANEYTDDRPQTVKFKFNVITKKKNAD